jgi:hypothetical protein
MVFFNLGRECKFCVGGSRSSVVLSGVGGRDSMVNTTYIVGRLVL